MTSEQKAGGPSQSDMPAPAANRQLDRDTDALVQDQQQHQDRGQSNIEDEQQR